MTLAQQFLKISALLTGFGELPHSVSNTYLERLREDESYSRRLGPFLSDCAAWSQVSSQCMLDNIRQNIDYERLARGIIYLWYTAEFTPWDDLNKAFGDLKKQSLGSPEEYYAGLLWKAIRAHPPGLSGGYYGHWKYEPEN